MSEVWVRANRRPLIWGMSPPLVLLIIGVVFAALPGGARVWPRYVGVGFIVVALTILAGLAWMFLRPVLAYRDGKLLVYLRLGAPLRVPINVVEGFLLGRAAAFVPGQSRSTAETAALVVRLADSATEWSHIETHPALARWCDGYITIRGTWCEPLSVEFVNGLNARLGEVHGRSPAPSPLGTDGSAAHD